MATSHADFQAKTPGNPKTVKGLRALQVQGTCTGIRIPRVPLDHSSGLRINTSKLHRRVCLWDRW
jgi:hypothetical protein